MNNGKGDGSGCKLVDRNTGRVVVESLELATSFWQRFCGWQFRAIPSAGSGILLTPCNSIHTFGMRFAIDVAFLAEDGRLLTVRSHVVPWRIVAPVRGARAVVELPSGRCLLQEGQQLAVATTNGEPRTSLPRGLLAGTAADRG